MAQAGCYTALLKEPRVRDKWMGVSVCLGEDTRRVDREMNNQGINLLTGGGSTARVPCVDCQAFFACMDTTSFKSLMTMFGSLQFGWISLDYILHSCIAARLPTRMSCTTFPTMTHKASLFPILPTPPPPTPVALRRSQPCPPVSHLHLDWNIWQFHKLAVCTWQMETLQDGMGDKQCWGIAGNPELLIDFFLAWQECGPWETFVEVSILTKVLKTAFQKIHICVLADVTLVDTECPFYKSSALAHLLWTYSRTRMWSLCIPHLLSPSHASANIDRPISKFKLPYVYTPDSPDEL